MVGQRTDPHELLIHHLVMGKIHIGISGWRHPPWRGVFYPDDLTQERELEYASRALPAIADTAGKWPYCEDVTADFIYLRLHRDKELYASGYSDEALDRWGARSRAWAAGSQPSDAQLISSRMSPKRASRDLFCYFDNAIKVHAPFGARRLIEKLGLLRSPESGLE